MSEHIWIVRSPEGKAIGAGIVASGAIRDTQAHCGSTTYGIMQRMFGHVHSGTEDSYEQDGYTLTREPLTPPAPASAPRAEVSDRVAVDAFGRLVDALGVITDRLTEAVERKPASAPRGEAVACNACHGEREVSEHECCGNSTNGDCCGQSIEVRVPCLFCGDGTVTHPPAASGVTEAEIALAREAYRAAWWQEEANADGEPFNEEARKRIWYAALTASRGGG